jgi:hypothetical protein
MEADHTTLVFSVGQIIGEFHGTWFSKKNPRCPAQHSCMIQMLTLDNETYVLVCDHLSDAQLLTPKDIPIQYNIQFINHACEPNCVMEIWRDVNGWFRAVVIAMEDIYHLMELTIHYHWEATANRTRTPCNCGLKELHYIESLVDRPGPTMILPSHTANRLCSMVNTEGSGALLSPDPPPVPMELTIIK